MYSPGFIVVKFDHFGLNTIAIPHPAGGELQELKLEIEKERKLIESALENKDFT